MNQAPNDQPDKQFRLMLVLIVAFNTIPHTLELPPWITIAAVSFLLWAALHLYRNIPLPPFGLRLALSIGGFAGILLQWRTVLGQGPATALLVYLASLKLLESTRYRDAMLVIFTSYFLLMAHLLVSQSLPSTLFMAIDVLLITTLMFHLHKRDRRTSVRSFRPAMRLLAIALPVWIFLFIAFPRFSTSLWRLQTKPPTQTGFSDNMSPGELSELADSDAPAFRVVFKSKPLPNADALYWRGAILHMNENGLKWTRSGSTALRREHLIPSSGAGTVHQEIVLEPGFQRWLFGLDYPRTLEFDDPRRQSLVRQRHGFIFEMDRELEQKALYQVSSTLQAPRQSLTTFERNSYLQIPPDMTNDVRELARKLKSETDGTTIALVQRVLRWYDDEGFRYTKSPGVLQTGLLREFLFETKRGFCEHYSGSFATLMRLMGVPARVVVGFQGGAMNAFGGYMLVRHLDAHAWAEVWNESAGRWQRVDPTGTIAPLRLQLGGDFNQLNPDQIGTYTPEMLRSGLNKSAISRFLSRATQAWDATTTSWNSFLLRYDFSYQQELFARFGLASSNRWIFFIWVGAGILIFVVILQFVLRRRAAQEDPLLEGYHRFCTRLEKAGLCRYPSEGPLHFLDRAARFKPEQASEIEALTREFISLRYGRPPQGDASAQSRRDRIRDFRRRSRDFQIRS